MYCESCGVKAQPNFKFCVACGHTRFVSTYPNNNQTSSQASFQKTATVTAPPIQQTAPIYSSPTKTSIDVSGMSYASFGRRLAAFILDYMIAGLAITIITLPIQFIGFINNSESATITVIILATVINWAYYSFQYSGAKQSTFGKRIMGLVIANMQGEKISLGCATGRFFGMILSSFLFLGYFLALFTERNQTLHDKMAGTVVLYRGA